MLESFTIDTFANRLGETFRICPEGIPPLSTELISAADLRGNMGRPLDKGDRRAPFSLVFRGPGEIVLPQRIYHMEHDELGAFDLFIVPIGPDGQGMRYEAVFT